MKLQTVHKIYLVLNNYYSDCAPTRSEICLCLWCILQHGAAHIAVLCSSHCYLDSLLLFCASCTQIVFRFLILVPLTVLGRYVDPLKYFPQMSVCLCAKEPVLSWRRSYLHMWFTPGQAFLHLGLEQLHLHVLNFHSPLVVLLYPDWDRNFYYELCCLNMYELWTVKYLYSFFTTFDPPSTGQFWVCLYTSLNFLILHSNRGCALYDFFF